MAEEVKRPTRNLPIAILASLGLTSLLYVCVSMTIVLAVDQQELAASKSPLSLVFAKGGRAAVLLTGVGMLSGLNGALVQIVMASRVAFGLAKNREAPAWLAKVNPKTRTPVFATIAITGVVLGLALWLPIVSLAKVTSTILLGVYALVNLSLVVVRIRDRRSKAGPSYPLWLPITGFITCVAFLLFHALTLIFGNQ